MDFIVQNLVPYLLLYKYVTIFLIAFFAAFIVPVPSGSILMAASAFASFGYFNLFWVIIISMVGNILGDNLGYWVARIYGREVLAKIGFRKVLESKAFKNIEDEFNKRPGFIVFASRFEVLSTLSVNLLSGISKTSYKKFFLHESFGSVAQVCVYSLLGFLFADNWESINSAIGKISLVVGLIVILFIFSLGRKTLIRKLK
jgi:membrane protein DedA with SNARE-associated domain